MPELAGSILFLGGFYRALCLFDAGFLAGEVTQVENTCAAYFTIGRSRLGAKTFEAPIHWLSELLGGNVSLALAIIAAQQVTLIPAEEIRKRGMKETIREVLGRLTVPAIHISFDVDFLDETAFSSTGYRMPDGLTPDDAAEALRACFEDGRVCSLDCVEYNPLMDETGADREKLFRLLDLAAAYTDAHTPHAGRCRTELMPNPIRRLRKEEKR